MKALSSMKALRVVVIMEFDNVEDTESPKADQIIQSVSADAGKAWCSAWGADRVWVDNALIWEYRGDRK
jgi:hypothetical protein